MLIQNHNRANAQITLRTTGQVSQGDIDGIFDVPEEDAALLLAGGGWVAVGARVVRPFADVPDQLRPAGTITGHPFARTADQLRPAGTVPPTPPREDLLSGDVQRRAAGLLPLPVGTMTQGEREYAQRQQLQKDLEDRALASLPALSRRQGVAGVADASRRDSRLGGREAPRSQEQLAAMTGVVGPDGQYADGTGGDGRYADGRLAAADGVERTGLGTSGAGRVGTDGRLGTDGRVGTDGRLGTDGRVGTDGRLDTDGDGVVDSDFGARGGRMSPDGRTDVDGDGIASDRDLETMTKAQLAAVAAQYGVVTDPSWNREKMYQTVKKSVLKR